MILPFFSQYGPKSDVFRNVPKWYFSFRRWYFFSVKCSLVSVFWNFFFKKKISQKKISLFTFFIYKIVISEFAKTEKVEKKSWFASRIWCDFFFFEIWSFLNFDFCKKKYHRQNLSENEFQIPLLQSEINEKFRNFFLRIQKTPSRGT